MIRKALHFLFVLALFAGLSLSLSACGKKPKFVDAPPPSEGQPAQKDTFPETYPKPWL